MSIYTARYISEELDGSALTNTYRYLPNSAQDIDTKGELHCLITVIGEKEIQADRVAKFVWDSIVDSYYFSTFDTVIDNLKRSVEIGSKKASELIQNGDGNAFNLSFALSVFKGKGAYLTVFGEQQMLLYKNGGFVKVSDIVTQNKGVVASMAWSSEDLLILGSPNVLDGFPAVIKMGDSPKEVARAVEIGSKSLKGYQSILLISGKELVQQPVSVKKVETAKVVAPLIPKHVEESKEEVIDEVKEDVVEEAAVPEQTYNIVSKPENKFEYKKYVDSVKSFFSKIKSKVEPLVSKVSPTLSKVFGVLGKVPEFFGNLFRRIFSKLNSLVMDKYGRQHWYKKFMANLSSFSFLKKKSGVGIKIDGYKENDLRKKRFAIVFYLIFGLGTLYFLFQYGTKTAADKKVSKEVNASLQVLENKIDEIDKIRLTDPDQAQVDMFDLKDQMAAIENKKLPIDVMVKYNNIKEKYTNLENVFLKKFLLSEIKGEISLLVDGRVRFGDTTNLSDISSYKDGFQNEFLLITDAGNGTVYKLNISDKSITPVNDTKKALKVPKYIDYGVSGVFVYDEESGVIKAPFGKNGEIGNFSAVSGLDKDVIGASKVVDLAILGQADNVYLLSTSDSAIMKSSKTGSGYSYPFAYVTAKSFANANNLANDISFYVMTSGLKGIERYSNDYVKGGYEPNKVTLEDLSGDPTTFKAGYTSSIENSKFYAFDESEKRLLVFEKPVESGATLVHPKQLLLEKQMIYKGDRQDVFSDVKELSTDYFENYLYILDGNRIWQVKLK